MIDSLRAALAQYANRELDLAALEDWVVGNLQSIIDSRDHESIDIARSLDARFIELGEGLVTEEEVANEVHALVPPIMIVSQTSNNGSSWSFVGVTEVVPPVRVPA